MRNEVFHRPDEAAMWKQMEEQPDELSTVVLQLAWREGLSRREIWALRWDGVDLDTGYLHLPDRDVPLEDAVADHLRRWRASFGAGELTYVASSRRTRERIAAPSLSRSARDALDNAGQKEVRLIDLRHDFVRRMLEQYDWAYVLRISGLSVTTYRALFAGGGSRGLPLPPPEEAERGSEERLWKALQENRSGPAGIGLWLAQQANVPLKEIVTLTWEQADLKKGVLHLARGDVYMIKEVIAILKEEKARRTPDDDPHIILSPRSRRPMDKARLSTIMHDLLIRAGRSDRSAEGVDLESMLQSYYNKI